LRNGFDVAAHMKTCHPHVHVYIITGCPDAVRSACPAGLAFRLIYKPMPPDRLCAQIAHLVEHQPQERRNKSLFASFSSEKEVSYFS
jgi:DNA-binding NtrC family response regulator